MRLLYNLTERVVKIYVDHYQKFTVNSEGAILLSGDINKYNELFLQVDADDIIKKYESFKLLVNIYLMNESSLEQYIREHLLSLQEKDIIINYLKRRADFKTAKLDGIITRLF